MNKKDHMLLHKYSLVSRNSLKKESKKEKLLLNKNKNLFLNSIASLRIKSVKA